MNTTPKLGRINSVSKWLVCGLALITAGLVGCPDGIVTGPCATVTVAGTGANNEYGDFTFEANQCNFELECTDCVNGALEIDILDRDATGSTIPRVRFVLDVDLTDIGDIPLVGFDLAREEDTTLPEPAIYQDYVDDTDPAEGSFWTSTSGTITFSVNADGDIIGTFDFEADNPPNPNEDNDAAGTLSVNGTITVVEAEEPEVPCGLGAAPASLMMLLGLGLMRSRRWRRMPQVSK